MLTLYKYLPSKYASAFLDRGEILFRNITYFRQHEGRVRGDPYDGIHKDHPGTNIVVENLTRRSKTVGEFSFLNSTDPDLVFAFCLSQKFSKDLMAKFESDACIEILEPVEFIRRVRFALARLVSVHRVGLLAQPVHYYHPAEAARFDIKEPTQLAFAKDMYYAEQEEFRLSFGTRRAFKLVQKITQPNYDPYDDAIKGQSREKLVKVGSLRDVAGLVQR
ncbi:MAG: hypothetical protein H6R07_1054 [Proteobacteria bacterium]|nr:hypothetical protein [Pseudomonadota bacterium]